MPWNGGQPDVAANFPLGLATHVEGSDVLHGAEKALRRFVAAPGGARGEGLARRGLATTAAERSSSLARYLVV